jgi:hypothetical protein
MKEKQKQQLIIPHQLLNKLQLLLQRIRRAFKTVVVNNEEIKNNEFDESLLSVVSQNCY